MIRRGFAAWLVALAVAATGLANFTLWSRSQLLDDQTFTRTTTSVLDNAAVRDVLASRITDAVMLQVPTEFADQRPTIEAGVRNVVDTPEFAATFSQAVATAHHAVFDGGDAGLTFDLTALEPTIRAEVARIQPGLESFLPTAEQIGTVQLVSPGDFPSLETPAEWARRLATGTVVAAIVLFAMALVISPNRATTLMAGGIGVAAVAGLTLFAIWGGRRVVLGQVDSPDSKDAVRSLSSALTDDLRTRTIVILIIGVALAGAGVAVAGTRRMAWFARSGAAFAGRARAREPQPRRAPQPTAARAQPAARTAVRRGDTIDVTPGAWDAYSGRGPVVDAGRDAYGRDAYGRDVYGRDAYGRDAYGRDSQGRDAYGRDVDGRDAYGRDAYGRDAYGRDAYGQDVPPRYAPPRPIPHDDGGPPTRSGPRQTSPLPMAAADPASARTAAWPAPAGAPAGDETNPSPPAPRQPIVPPAQRPRSGGTVGADQIMRDRQRARATDDGDETPRGETDRSRPDGVR